FSRVRWSRGRRPLVWPRPPPVDDEVFAVASVPADATAAVTAEAAMATAAAASHHLRFKVFIYGPSFLLRRGRNLDGGEPSPRVWLTCGLHLRLPRSYVRSAHEGITKE